MLSVIIPARNETFLFETVEDIFSKAKGEIEVIVILDGAPAVSTLKERPNLHIIHFGKPRGMRKAINAGISIAQGKYIMKSDAHCMYEKGFDVKLKGSLKENWIAVPRRYSLNPEEWRRRRKGPLDYLYIATPENQGYWGGVVITSKPWREKNYDLKLREKLIDDLMSFQGSCYFMHKDYFDELELLDSVNFGGSGKEALEVSIKCWLSGGRVIRNKKTWYAHLHKGRGYGRGFRTSSRQYHKSSAAINKWLLFDKPWVKQEYDFKWLINKFNPPGWEDFQWKSDDWKKKLTSK
jgi:glycosyltransferase involved in cell wall biosynthesis